MGRPRTTYRFGRGQFRNMQEGIAKEWLMTNGIGGYANSAINGDSSRIFSSYLIASKHAPVDRLLILAKTHEELQNGGRVYDLATQEYPGEAREGYRYMTSFSFDVYPEYCYQVAGITVKKRIALEYGKNRVAITYEIQNNGSATCLAITPLLNYRPFGDVCEKSDLKFQIKLEAAGAEQTVAKEEMGTVSSCGGRLTLIPESVPTDRVVFEASAGYFYDRKKKPVSMATPNYLIEENQFYGIDAMNGFTGVDNHVTPYEVRIELKPFEKKTVSCLCSLESVDEAGKYAAQQTAETAEKIFADMVARAEQLLELADAKDAFGGRLVLSADAFLVNRESTGKRTVLAGYPWFSDWGRDTMIAFTGLTLATGRFAEAKEVLESFAVYVKNGMIPNVFPGNAGEEPMYNTIDASLWYFYAVHQYLNYTGDREFVMNTMYPVLREVFESYRDGKALYGIHMDKDGLITGGNDLDQLTWMDVRVGEVVVTPRHGKAVEINALWYHALRFMQELSGEKEYADIAELVKKNYAPTFWNETEGCLYDVINTDGTPDASIRPNQIYAVAMPYELLTPEQERRVVQKVYEELYTPYGLRSLSPHDERYRPVYKGKLLGRDLAYHMGTAWGYLIGGFMDAVRKVGGKEADVAVREMCLCFADHMADGCLGGIAEIFDGEYACDSRGCYTQAWSVAEVLRVWSELKKGQPS